MRLSAKVSGLDKVLAAADEQARTATTKAMGQATDSLKQELRSQITGAGLSDRLARTWQGKTYPGGGRKSLSPASYVWTKAPAIVDAFARGVTIVPTGGKRFLALPTDAVPKRSGKALTPVQVEQRYGRKLRFVPASSADGAKFGGKAVAYLVLDNLVARTGAKPRRASAREVAAASKRVTAIVMFTLVASVRMPKKLDLQGAADKVAGTIPQLLADSWGEQ